MAKLRPPSFEQETKKQFQALNKEQRGMKQEMQETKIELRDLKQEMLEVKKDIQTIKEDLQLVLRTLDTFANAVERRFVAIEQRLDRVEATTVTKDYLDDKLGDLRGNLNIKFDAITDVLVGNRVMTLEQSEQVKRLRM